ncbi:MAG TPA: sigma factor [Mycobacteriales bacterium]
MTFEDFMAARGQALLRYAVMLTGDRDLALDVTQEAMARAALRWRRISQTDRPELYVKRMVTNEYLNWRRGSWFRRIVLRGEPVPDWQDGPTTVLDHAEDAVRHDEVWQLLAELNVGRRAGGGGGGPGAVADRVHRVHR